MKLPEGFDFTQSNLQDYLDCAYRFYLRYIRKMKWPALVVEDAVKFEQRGQAGARFHRLIQQYLNGVPEGQLTKMAANDVDPDINGWWRDFLAYVPSWLEGEKYSEITLSTILDENLLVAKYDLILIDQDSHQLSIFDWKTSQKTPKRDWLLDRIQTRLYRFILAQASSSLILDQSFTPQDITMHYWFTSYPESTISLPYNQTIYQKDRTFFTSLLQEIEDKPEENFVKTSDFNKCHYCVYRSHCDRGTYAGDLTDFDDFNTMPDAFEDEMDFENIPEIKF